MNIDDLLDQGIRIQGKVTIQQVKGNNTNALFTTADFESDHLKSTISVKEITYMYCQDDRLIIEVK